MNLGEDDAIITVATDGADLYLSELEKTKKEFKGIYDESKCAEIYGQYLKGISTDNTLELYQKDATLHDVYIPPCVLNIEL